MIQVQARVEAEVEAKADHHQVQIPDRDQDHVPQIKESTKRRAAAREGIILDREGSFILSILKTA